MSDSIRKGALSTLGVVNKVAELKDTELQYSILLWTHTIINAKSHKSHQYFLLITLLHIRAS
jgi:hypothetical protein